MTADWTTDDLAAECLVARTEIRKQFAALRRSVRSWELDGATRPKQPPAPLRSPQSARKSVAGTARLDEPTVWFADDPLLLPRRWFR